jgi:hypothetical protein
MKNPYIYLLETMLFALAVLGTYAYQRLIATTSVGRAERGLKP